MSPLSRLLGRKAAHGTDTIRTARLLLRPLDEGDIDVIVRLAGDWDVASMTARIPYPYTAADARAWLAELEPGEVVRGIERDGELVGATGCLPALDGGSAEIGYWIGKPYWGNGYATEAATALVAHCFATLPYDRLTCCHFSDNAASARVIAKLGFRHAGSCSHWCEARRIDAPAEHYQLMKPRRGGLRRKASA